MSTTTSTTTTPRNCCFRVCWELRVASWFGLDEPNGSILDARASFAPQQRWKTIVRVLFFVWNFATLVADLYQYPQENLFIFMGYLTHWTWVICLVYQFLAMCMSTCCQPTQPSSETTSSIGCLTRTLWILYSIAAPASLAVAILYWTMDYDGGAITYYNVMKHGLVGIMVLVDGLGLCHVPVRLKHFLFFWLYGICFLVWSFLHAQLEIGNGTFEDDALYDVLKWNENQQGAIVLSAIVLLGLLPFCYLTTWWLSVGIKCNASKRPTIETKSSSPQDNYVEMSSV